MPRTFIKDPQATLDYTFDWSHWLQPGERLDTVTWTLGSGITNAGESEDERTATVFVSGGTAGTDYTVTCTITTTQARTDERSITLAVVSR